MSCHPYIHEAEKRMMVSMNGRGYSAKDIADATGRADSTIYRMLAKHRNTGNVVMHNLPIVRISAYMIDIFTFIPFFHSCTFITVTITVSSRVGFPSVLYQD